MTPLMIGVLSVLPSSCAPPVRARPKLLQDRSDEGWRVSASGRLSEERRRRQHCSWEETRHAKGTDKCSGTGRGHNDRLQLDDHGDNHHDVDHRGASDHDATGLCDGRCNIHGLHSPYSHHDPNHCRASDDKRDLMRISKRVCIWLYVMNEEGMVISVSGQGLVCVHDLNSLVGPDEQIKLKTAKLIEDARGD